MENRAVRRRPELQWHPDGPAGLSMSRLIDGNDRSSRSVFRLRSPETQ